ncbi:MAG: RHS repeat-associated core domain-containing protein [Ferruginibacter sp.]
MPGRIYRQSSSSYRYGFNGKENDDEIKGDGNQQDYGMRIYDPRLGRFLSVDPITNDYPELTPYQFASNCPITGVDQDGLEFFQANNGKIYRNHIAFLQKEGPVETQTQVAVQVGMAMLNSKATAIPPKKNPVPIANVSFHSEKSLIATFIPPSAPTYRGAIVRQWCQECETKETKEQEKAIIKRENYELGKDENGNDFAITLLEKNKTFKNFSNNIALPTLSLYGVYGTAKSIISIGRAIQAGALETSTIKYIGRLNDLKSIPRSQTFLDDLPNLGTPKANYYQNMSVLRKALRDGYTIRDASWFRSNLQGAPTILNPSRTIGQTFTGAERNLLNNRGLWLKK